MACAPIPTRALNGKQREGSDPRRSARIQRLEGRRIAGHGRAAINRQYQFGNDRNNEGCGTGRRGRQCRAQTHQAVRGLEFGLRRARQCRGACIGTGIDATNGRKRRRIDRLARHGQRRQGNAEQERGKGDSRNDPAVHEQTHGRDVTRSPQTASNAPAAPALTARNARGLRFAPGFSAAHRHRRRRWSRSAHGVRRRRTLLRAGAPSPCASAARRCFRCFR